MSKSQIRLIYRPNYKKTKRKQPFGFEKRMINQKQIDDFNIICCYKPNTYFFVSLIYL